MTTGKLVSTAILLIAAGSAFADGSSHYPGDLQAQAAASGKTRAEVIAELRAAEANGEMNLRRYYEFTPDQFVGTRSRSEVRLEAASLSQTQDILNRNH